jgi:hypothetical protein
VCECVSVFDSFLPFRSSLLVGVGCPSCVDHYGVEHRVHFPSFVLSFVPHSPVPHSKNHSCNSRWAMNSTQSTRNRNGLSLWWSKPKRMRLGNFIFTSITRDGRPSGTPGRMCSCSAVTLRRWGRIPMANTFQACARCVHPQHRACVGIFGIVLQMGFLLTSCGRCLRTSESPINVRMYVACLPRPPYPGLARGRNLRRKRRP